jgi:hypothetical protein
MNDGETGPVIAPPHPAADDERPPFFGSWSALYAVVLVYLALLITFLYIFSRSYS